jgi:hypothetical protein
MERGTLFLPGANAIYALGCPRLPISPSSLTVDGVQLLSY